MGNNAKDSADYYDDKDQADSLRKGNGVHCGELAMMMLTVALIMVLGACLIASVL